MARDKRNSSPKRAQLAMLELEIEKIAGGGRGLAFTEDRRAVLLPHVAPGDRVRAEVDLAQRPARGRLVEMLRPSPDRVEAPCPIATVCGGCDLMFLGQEKQRAVHVDIVRDVLPTELRGITIGTFFSRTALQYRTRARLHVDARAGKAPVVGFLAAGSHDIVVPQHCFVLAASLESTRRCLSNWFVGAKGRGEVRLALGAFPARNPVVDITWRGELPAALFATLERLTRLASAPTAGEGANEEGALAGARIATEGASRPAIFGDPTPFAYGADGEPLALSHGGFGQASDDGNAQLAACVLSIATELAAAPAEDGAPPIVELFAGAGNFTVGLVRLGARVTAVESDAAACEAARKNLAARGLSAKVVNADAETFALPRGLRCVLLDPPRTGARGACAHIVDARPAHVVYVSCDPQTLGRDLGTLINGGYDVASVDVVEMFPQTSHVETIVLLTRRRGNAR